MNLIQKTINILEEAGIKARYISEENIITFNGIYNNKTEINVKHIVSDGNLIVWFQKDDFGYSLLRSFEKNINLNYEPESNHPDFGIECLFLKIIGNSIVFVYNEKHSDNLCSIKNGKVKRERLRLGTKMFLKENIFYFKNPEYVEEDNQLIKKIKIPELINLNDISERELEKLNVKLSSNYFLYNP